MIYFKRKSVCFNLLVGEEPATLWHRSLV